MNHKQRHWGVTFHRDGDHVVLYERDAKAMAWNFLFQLVEELDAHVFRHHLCQPAEWSYKIPLGKPDYDHDFHPGWINNSLGSKWYDITNKVICGLWNKSEGKLVVRLPISDEQAVELHPDMAFLYEDDEDNDN